MNKKWLIGLILLIIVAFGLYKLSQSNLVGSQKLAGAVALANKAVCPAGVQIGDVNADGKIDAIDSALLGRYAADPAFIQNYPCADTNGDKQFNAVDVQKLNNCILNANCGPVTAPIPVTTYFYDRLDPYTPRIGNVAISSTQVTPDITLGIFGVKLMVNTGTLTTLVFKVNSDSTLTANQILQNIRLVDGTTVYGASSFVNVSDGGLVTFSNLNLKIPTANAWKSLKLKADISAAAVSSAVSVTMIGASTVGVDSNWNAVSSKYAASINSNRLTLVPGTGVIVSSISVSKGNVVTAPGSSIWSLAYPTLTFTVTNNGNFPIYVNRTPLMALATSTSPGPDSSATVSTSYASGGAAGDTVVSYSIEPGVSRTFSYYFIVSNTSGRNIQKRLAITQINYGTGSAWGTGPGQNAQYHITEGIQNLSVVEP